MTYRNVKSNSNRDMYICSAITNFFSFKIIPQQYIKLHIIIEKKIYNLILHPIHSLVLFSF